MSKLIPIEPWKGGRWCMVLADGLAFRCRSKAEARRLARGASPYYGPPSVAKVRRWRRDKIAVYADWGTKQPRRRRG